MLKSFFSAITRASLKFWWLTIGITIVLLGLGVYAATRMNLELIPNIEFPEVFVLVQRPGTSEEIRDLVTIPLEKEVATIKGVLPAGLESTTSAPVAFLTV